MRVSRQPGYRSVKYITELTMTDNINQFGKGLGSAASEGGYAWYAPASRAEQIRGVRKINLGLDTK